MGISPVEFYTLLAANNIDFFTGVPDSLLKEFCLCIDDNVPKHKHVIAANEGNAIALGSGYYLGTGKLPLIYMQNSGLGNSVNPLLSLCDPDVYSIPMLVIVGWRGEPGVHDEPQHIKQGKIQLDLLKALDIPYVIISRDEENLSEKILYSIDQAENRKSPVVILIKKGSFDKYRTRTPDLGVEPLLTREEFLEIALERIPKDSIIVSTTGKTSREIFEIRERNHQPHNSDFLTVGSMGHCSSIALGIALAKPERKVVCFDGDGALIMHMGALSTVGKLQPPNFYHILINNKIHESVGGQETSAKFIDIPGIVKSNAYKQIYSVGELNTIGTVLKNFLSVKGPAFLEIHVKPGSRKDLGRPTIKPVDNKIDFMEFVIR